MSVAVAASPATAVAAFAPATAVAAPAPATAVAATVPATAVATSAASLAATAVEEISDADTARGAEVATEDFYTQIQY